MAQSRNSTFPLVWRISHYHVLLSTFAAALMVIGSVYFWGTSKGIPLAHLTGDPAMITRTPLHIGILSNLGVMLWAAAATSAFLGAALQKTDIQRLKFLLFSGLFSTFLGLDDLLSIHEHVLPHYLHIPEKFGYLGYLFLAGIYVLGFFTILLKETNYLILGIAWLFFGLSFATMFLQLNGFEAFVKDSLKFLGIVYWLVYFFCTTLRFLQEGLQREPQ
jgi:hypothetical protein